MSRPRRSLIVAVAALAAFAFAPVAADAAVPLSPPLTIDRAIAGNRGAVRAVSFTLVR